MDLSVVIVNYNVKYFLEQCLDSLLNATTNISTEIFVVDNASSDGSIPYLNARFKEVTFLCNDENLGFAKANNIAIKKAKGKYVLLLNPDTLVRRSTIEQCVHFMDKHPDAGGTGVRMLNPDGTFAFESRRGFPSPLTSFFKITGLCNLFPKSHLFGKYYLRYLDEHNVCRIDVISGAYMFLRKEALEKAGLLDEDFFMYGEDVDLSYRITQAGYQNYYLPETILHYKGESTKKDSLRYVQIFYDAMLIFFRKHYPHYSSLLAIPIKGAIHMRASVAYGKRIIHKLISKNEVVKENIRFLILGNESTRKEVGLICKKNNLSQRHDYICVDDSNALVVSAKNAQKYSHLVFDRKVFSHSSMIENLLLMNGKAEIGIYSPEEHIVITPQKIYR